MAESSPPPSRTIVIVGQGGIQTDLDLDSLADAEVADVIPDLLADYSAECKDWTLIAGEHWRAGRLNRAEDLLAKGVTFFGGGQGRHADHTAVVNLHVMMAHVHLAMARTAPKIIVPHAKYDVIAPKTHVKEFHYNEATAHLNYADEALRASGTGPEDEPNSVAMGKIILYLARGQPNIAHPLVDRLLLRQPNNLIGLAAQARLQFARRAHDAALVTYQKMLLLDPEMRPDPRIGLGLCAWILGDRERAREAWNRALELDSQSWAALLLLGLASLNVAREPSHSTEERLIEETQGVQHVQRAFKLNNKSAAAALALSVVTAQRQVQVASKLSERAIQYSDNRRHSVLANAERGRLGFIAGDVADAGPYISAAKSEDPTGVNMIAELTLGQIAIKNGNLREALNFVEQTAKRLGGRGPLEFTVLHASLLAYPHLGMPADERARNRLIARTMLSDIHAQVASATTEEDWAKLRGIGEDADVFVELARLWQEENIDKAISAYQTAVSIKSEAEAVTFDLVQTTEEFQDRKPVDFTAVRLTANLGSLYAMQGNVETAESMFSEALQKIGPEEGKDAETLKTIIAYDLGRAYEEGGDVVQATQWYRDVLRQHPEHMESKVRLAALAASAGRNVDAHTLLKECLRADESSLALRSVYTTFLISIGSYKEALAFTTQTLKFDRSDTFTYTALGWLHFTLGREAKSGPDLAERTKQYLRSGEAYERALTLDPTNAVAAQGLAIALAEDTLTPKSAQAVAGSAEEQKIRIRLAGQALSVFGRIKDSLPEGPVSVNIGHCYFVRGEEERAIEAYGAALNSFSGRNVSVLLYLSRAWYAYANRESNFSAMGQALSYSQKAMHLQPSDRAILYNIAMIQQKAAEMLLALEPSKRTLEELQLALQQAQQSISTFRALADDKSGALAYDPDLADQRARYGESLLRKAPEQVTRQEAFEGEAAARVEEARKARADEQARIQAAEAVRRAEIEARAAELAEHRRAAREEARLFHAQMESQAAEEETRKAVRAEQRKRRKDDRGDEDDAEGGGDSKPRKRRAGGGGKKSRKGRSKSEISTEDGMDVDEEAEARYSGAESGADEEDAAAARANTLALLKSRKKKANKRVIRDESEEMDDSQAPGRRGKQFKSKAIIEDSDEDENEAKDEPAPEPEVDTSVDDDDE